jgi:hypothetical protein
MIYEILIGLVLIGYNSFEIVRIIFFKIDKNALLVGLTSMISIGFGLHLFIKNGLILDYGTETEISTNWAGLMWLLGVVCILIGLGFIISSILKNLIWKLKN